MATSAPAWPRASAIPRPMRRAPPVTSTDLPFRVSVGILGVRSWVAAGCGPASGGTGTERPGYSGCGQPCWAGVGGCGWRLLGGIHRSESCKSNTARPERFIDLDHQLGLCRPCSPVQSLEAFGDDLQADCIGHRHTSMMALPSSLVFSPICLCPCRLQWGGRSPRRVQWACVDSREDEILLFDASGRRRRLVLAGKRA